MTTPLTTKTTPVERVPSPQPTLTYGSVQINLEQVNPDRARELLRLNTANRPLTKSAVDKYTSFMDANDWSFTADPIKISSDGILLDGQHRLNAVLNSGKTIPILIARGLEPAIFTNLDQGKRRNLADFLALLGVTHYTNVASSIIAYARYLNLASANQGRLTNKQAIALYESKKDLFDEAAYFAANNKRDVVFPQSVVGALFALVMEYYLGFEDYDDAVDFTKNYMVPLVHGHDLGLTDARFIVRKKVIGWAEQGSKPSSEYLLIMLVKATNLWLKGSEVKAFRMPVVDSNGVFYKPAVGS